MSEHYASSDTLRPENGTVNTTGDTTSRTPLLSATAPWRPKVHDTCPTCKGKGKIQRDALNDNELVALIPLGDNRLKPRRTKTVIFLTVVLTALVLGFIIFFLYPRSVSVSVVSGSAANLTVACIGDNDLYLDHFNMSIYWTLHVHNNNYMAVNIKKGNLVMKGLGSTVMGNMSVAFDTIPHRHSGDVLLVVNASAPLPFACRFKQYCLTNDTGPNNRVAVEFMLNLTVVIMSFHEPVVLDTFVPVTCPIPEAPIVPGSTLPPITTLTPPTTAPSTTSLASTSISPWVEQVLSTPSPAAPLRARVTETFAHYKVDNSCSNSLLSHYKQDPRHANCTGPLSRTCR
eukprot:m.50372 g.50372  ORF g.50372 m.50372 type:complete len:344 (-) comp13414_c0_seq1:113-1144(-)